MGLRFRKSIKIAPGLKLNIGKSSVGLSAGVKGAHVSVNSKGRVTKSVGIPGTGVSYVDTQNINSNKGNSSTSNITANSSEKKQKKKMGCLPKILIVLVVMAGLGACFGNSSDETSPDSSASSIEQSVSSETSEMSEPEVIEPETASVTETENPESEISEAAETQPETDTPAAVETEQSEPETVPVIVEEPKETAQAEEPANEVQYIGNSNSKKFHSLSCSDVKKISESNKVSLYSRDEAINKGYVPCKRCNP